MTHDHHPDRFTAGPHFDYDPRTRVVYGPGRIERLASLASELGATTVLLCPKPGIREGGHAGRGARGRRDAGVHGSVSDDTQPTPATGDVDPSRAIARGCRAERVIGIGGGSSMDCA